MLTAYLQDVTHDSNTKIGHVTFTSTLTLILTLAPGLATTMSGTFSLLTALPTGEFLACLCQTRGQDVCQMDDSYHLGRLLGGQIQSITRRRSGRDMLPHNSGCDGCLATGAGVGIGLSALCGDMCGTVYVWLC